MKKFLLYILFFTHGLCVAMEINNPMPEIVPVITKDKVKIEIEADIAQCMGLIVNLFADEKSINFQDNSINLSMVDSNTLLTILEILKKQSQKPSIMNIEELQKKNKKLSKKLFEKQNKLLSLKEPQRLYRLLSLKEHRLKRNGKELSPEKQKMLNMLLLKAEQNKTLLPECEKGMETQISRQGNVIEELDQLSPDKNTVASICEKLDFAQMSLLIEAAEFLGIPFLGETLATIAITKKIDYHLTHSNNNIKLQKHYRDNILRQKLFAIRETLPIDIYTVSKWLMKKHLILGETLREFPAPMKLTPGGKYLIYESFELKKSSSKETDPAIIFWDCKENKQAEILTSRTMRGLFYSPNLQYLRMFHDGSSSTEFSKIMYTTYQSSSLERVWSGLDPYGPTLSTQNNVYIFDAENSAVPLERYMNQPFLTDEQVKMAWEGNPANLSQKQMENKYQIQRSLVDIYERHNVNKKLLLSMTPKRKYITINSTQDFSCVKIIPALIDERKFNIEKIAFSPSGEYLAACGQIGFPTTNGDIWKPTLRVWQTSDWSCVGTIIDEKNATLKKRNTFNALSFAPDDSMIAVSNPHKKEVYLCGPLNIPEVDLTQFNYCMYHMQEDGKVDDTFEGIYAQLPDTIKNCLKKPLFLVPKHLEKFTSLPKLGDLLTKDLDIASIVRDDFPIKKPIYPRQLGKETDRYKARLFGSKSAQSLLKKLKEKK